ncbi:radical SAM protein [Treponema primitia]|uniref:radical SAM protein n=1 Tax=Treponema primitia TaxID=88058 RepID=UPI00397F180A
MSDIKQKLYDELYLRLALTVEGVQYDVGVFDKLLQQDPSSRKREVCTRDKELVTKKNYNIPYQFLLPYGFLVNLVVDRKSPYKIVEEDGVFSITYFGKWITNITFPKAPLFYSKLTSDGVSMREIAQDQQGGGAKGISVAYSQECSVKDKGKTCLFCVYNGNKGLDKIEEQPAWRTPLQIAETFKEAHKEGYNRLNITGGFIPERRELEYYLDVAETVQEHLEGKDDYVLTACIGAPQEISVINKYKEVGYDNMSFNLEVWGEEYFNVYCPGKVTECAPFDQWVKTVEYAVSTFGKGKIRNNFVAGLQPKEKLFEGLEYLTELGTIPNPDPWIPAIGSTLEGHRSPTIDWHWEVQLKNTALLRKYGRTSTEAFNTGGAHSYPHVMLLIEEEALPVFHEQKEVV